jgi:putative transposase
MFVSISNALQMAIFRRKRPKGVMVHSDQGSQYCSHDYRQLLQQHQLLGSTFAPEVISAKGNYHNNSVPESIFHSFKVAVIHGKLFGSRKAMRRAVFEYIESDYNPDGLRSRLRSLREHSGVTLNYALFGCILPTAFKAHWNLRASFE